MRPEDLARFGEPDICIGALRIWVHGRQFPDAQDYWDGNWLMTTAMYRSPGSWVCTSGPILRLDELVQLMTEGERLYSSLAGTATLPCIEPNLRVKMTGNGRGQIEVEVAITSDQILEEHRFRDQIDQTLLPQIIQACHAIISKYPVRGSSLGSGG